VARLQQWLATCSGFPGWEDVRIIEIGRGPHYEKIGDGPHAWRVAESVLHTIDGYATRFDGLLGAGYSWINLSCYGILDGVAILAVELPREPVGAPRGKTAVNFSGPPQDVKNGAIRWNAAGYVTVVRE
ncbi:MAG: hypothetical protein ACREJX_11810, partial [Polyangiaceae bacterium]